MGRVRRTEDREILDVVALDEDACFSEKAVVEILPLRVKAVQQHVGYIMSNAIVTGRTVNFLGGGEDNHFE